MLAIRGSADQLATYGVDSESYIQEMRDAQEKLAVIDKLTSVSKEIDGKPKGLYGAWRKAYEEQRSSQICRVNDKGNTTCTTYTYYEWDEPQQLTKGGLNNQRIVGWNDFLNRFALRIANLRTEAPNAYDLSRGDSVLYYTRNAVDSGSQELVALALYGLVGFGYMNYEEVIARLTRTETDQPLIDDRKRIKRRTFLKAVASFIGYLAIRDIQNAFAQDNENLLDKIREHTKEVFDQKDIDPTENFVRYFGITPLQLRQVLDDIRGTSKKALESGYDGKRGFLIDRSWDKIKGQLIELSTQAEQALERFDSFFSVNHTTGEMKIPDDLTEITADIWATEQIKKFVSSQTTRINLRHPLNALLLAFGLGGAALLTEALLLPVSDKILHLRENDNNLSP